MHAEMERRHVHSLPKQASRAIALPLTPALCCRALLFNSRIAPKVALATKEREHHQHV